ncbi:MAG: gluconokinase [Candidatus Thorarchaeota archaeon]
MITFNPKMLEIDTAYEHPIESIEIRETHISWVYLTGPFAYKIKKTVKFGDILDFSTLDLRKKFCHQEVKLNSRFSPDIYIGVFSVNSEGKINQPGEIIEYGVKMKQMPEKCLMKNILMKRGVSTSAIEKIADTLAKFHKNTEKVPERGKLKYIWEKWDENFRTTSQFRTESNEFQEQIFGFMRGNQGLFQERINDDRITDNHGDLCSNNIFILPDGEIKIFDCIEFNPLLRYGDLCEDVGFLAMDLDFWDEPKLSELFIEKYVEYSDDELLPEIIDFFKCYRAYVRGKVYGFQGMNEPNTQKKDELITLSNKYYDLAKSYVPNFIA